MDDKPTKPKLNIPPDAVKRGHATRSLHGAMTRIERVATLGPVRAEDKDALLRLVIALPVRASK